MVYFIRWGVGPEAPIKIGSAVVLKDRMQTHRREHGVEVEVLGVMDGGKPEEYRHHAMFSHLRIGRTERFRPAPDLLEYIANHCRQPTDADLGSRDVMNFRIDQRVRDDIEYLRHRWGGVTKASISDVVRQCLVEGVARERMNSSALEEG